VDKKAPPKEATRSGRDAEACERARVNRQLSCGAPYSARSRSFQCTEAIALQNQVC